MMCLPSCLELDDVFVLTQNLHSEDSFVEQVIDAADLLISEGREQGGRMLALNLHPWLVGQPHRVRTVREMFEALLVERGEAIWHASPNSIIEAASA
jgi:hypothetical protein